MENLQKHLVAIHPHRLKLQLAAVAWQDKEAGAEQEVFLSEQVLVLACVIQPLLQSAKISYLDKESIK